jgi:hypothetical protein
MHCATVSLNPPYPAAVTVLHLLQHAHMQLMCLTRCAVLCCAGASAAPTAVL